MRESLGQRMSNPVGVMRVKGKPATAGSPEGRRGRRPTGPGRCTPGASRSLRKARRGAPRAYTLGPERW